MAQERLSNLGYMALIKEVTPNTPLTPTTFVPLYKDSMATDVMLDLDNPIIGLKYKNYQAIQGQREHKGQVTTMGEGNTAGHLFNMLLNKTGVAGGNPYTHSFNSTSASDAATYTIDLLKGKHVFRFCGTRAYQISPTFNKNKMELVTDLVAQSSFTFREIASVSGAGPYTLTLNTSYDPSPTQGLVVGDIMQWYVVATGVYTNFTVATVPNGTTLTTVTNVSAAVAGDIISLRAQTPSYTLLAPFTWSNTQFCFGATASAALSAAQTNVEQGSVWTAKHDLANVGGEHRSGSLDPSSYARTQTDMDVKIKYFFDDPLEADRFMNIGARALVVRHYAGSTNQYELRLTFDQMVSKSMTDSLESGKLIYLDANYVPVYNTSDTQAFDVKVINALSTI